MSKRVLGVKRKAEVRRRREEEDAESDVSVNSSSGTEDESEGSLADFIEHDSGEEDAEVDDSYTEDAEDGSGEESEVAQSQPGKRRRIIEDSSEGEEAEEGEGEDVESATVTEEDPDEAIRAQYTPDMEQCGSIVVDGGIRRSMRSNKGKAPVRYIDEDYAELMLEDISPEDQAQLAEELTSSDTDYDDNHNNQHGSDSDE